MYSIDEVERTGQPALVTRHGRPAVAIVALDVAGLENLVLANAPGFVRAMRRADEELAHGTTRPLSALLAELDAEEATAANG